MAGGSQVSRDPGFLWGARTTTVHSRITKNLKEPTGDGLIRKAFAQSPSGVVMIPLFAECQDTVTRGGTGHGEMVDHDPRSTPNRARHERSSRGQCDLRGVLPLRVPPVLAPVGPPSAGFHDSRRRRRPAGHRHPADRAVPPGRPCRAWRRRADRIGVHQTGGADRGRLRAAQEAADRVGRPAARDELVSALVGDPLAVLASPCWMSR